jgi:hypothetical protein
MIRRVMSLLAVLGYAAGQLAAAPHAHGSFSEHHDARPHVHLSIFGGSHHHHDHDRSDAREDLTGARNSQSDHDDDAVYLQVVVSGAPQASQSQVELLEWSMLVAWLPAAMASAPPGFALSVACYEPCPNSTGDHCALYLTLQSLRI